MVMNDLRVDTIVVVRMVMSGPRVVVVMLKRQNVLLRLSSTRKRILNFNN